MGFLDKVKEQADKAKVQAQELKDKVGEKVDDVQAKRRADDLLDDLGRFLYADRTGRTAAGADAEIQRIVAELRALENDGVSIPPPPLPSADVSVQPTEPALEEPAAPSPAATVASPDVPEALP